MCIEKQSLVSKAEKESAKFGYKVFVKKTKGLFSCYSHGYGLYKYDKPDIKGWFNTRTKSFFMNFDNKRKWNENGFHVFKTLEDVTKYFNILSSSDARNFVIKKVEIKGIVAKGLESIYDSICGTYTNVSSYRCKSIKIIDEEIKIDEEV